MELYKSSWTDRVALLEFVEAAHIDAKEDAAST